MRRARSSETSSAAVCARFEEPNRAARLAVLESCFERVREPSTDRIPVEQACQQIAAMAAKWTSRFIRKDFKIHTNFPRLARRGWGVSAPGLPKIRALCATRRQKQ